MGKHKKPPYRVVKFTYLGKEAYKLQVRFKSCDRWIWVFTDLDGTHYKRWLELNCEYVDAKGNSLK